MAPNIDENSAPLLESGERPLPKGSWKKELRNIFFLALPCIVTTCSSQTMVVTDQIFVGHLGVTELAAAALGNTYFNLMWFFLLGCSTALDTLGSQAYGANDYSSLLTWTYAAGIVLSALCGVMAGGLWCGSWVAARLFMQPPEVAELVGAFCRALIPGLWPMMWSVVLMKFMQTQNCMLPPALVAAATCVLNVAANALLIHYLGFIGAPLATTASRFLQLLAYLAVTAWLQGRNHPPGGWGRWLARSRRCWARACSPRVLRLFMQLALPGGCMLALEAGSFDITTAFAGALGPVAVAAHSSLLAVCTYSFISFPFAVATAATIRVGNLLGAGRGAQAGLAARLCVLSGSGFQAACGVLMFLLRHKLGYLFTSDSEVVRAVASIALFGVAFQFCDGAFGTSQGVLRGMGRQQQLMGYNLVGFWGSGVAFGWWLTFKARLGLHGLWTGIATGDFAAAALCVVTWLLVDWRKEVKRAAERQAAAHDHGDDHCADLGHVEGEPDDWHDFLVPHKHTLLPAGEPEEGQEGEQGEQGEEGSGRGTAAAAGIPCGEGYRRVAAGGDEEDAISRALANPYGSPRFASPRCRGA